MKVEDLKRLIDDLNYFDEVFFINRVGTISEVFERVTHNGRVLLVLKNILPEEIPKPPEVKRVTTPNPSPEDDESKNRFEDIVPETVQVERRRGRPKKEEGAPKAPYTRKVDIENGVYGSGKKVGRPRTRVEEPKKRKRKPGRPKVKTKII